MAGTTDSEQYEKMLATVIYISLYSKLPMLCHVYDTSIY